MGYADGGPSVTALQTGGRVREQQGEGLRPHARDTTVEPDEDKRTPLKVGFE